MQTPSRPAGGRTEPPASLDALGSACGELLDAALRVGPGDCPELLERAARVIRGLTEELAPHRREAGGRPFYVRDARVGIHNPVQPRPRLETADGVTRGGVRFGVAFEGPPGTVHGGIVALLFDQLLGHHNVEIGTGGMTGRLEVRYRRPTPIDADLTLEARTLRRGERRAQVCGEIRHGDVITAQAVGLFMQRRRRSTRD